MLCDMVMSWPRAKVPKPPRVRCEQKAVQFVLTWNGTSAVALVARCKQHSVEARGRTDLKTISEQEAEVYSVHQE